ncbi:MAG TPA: hypothetical protein VFW96_10385 [Thermomicrobiales bacterium]|nr:hypothetical protein [Thermomicrobiales bacterium]
MGLQDRLNRHGDGGDLTPIEYIDAELTREADDFANRWHARTRVSRQTLTLGVYVIATVFAFSYALLTRQFLFLAIGALAYAGSMPGKHRGSLVEEIQLEAAGLPPQTLKYVNVFVLGVGLFGIFTSIPLFLSTLVYGGGLIFAVDGFVGGIALTALKIADYIQRTNPTPRNDGDREKPLARARLAASPVS